MINNFHYDNHLAAAASSRVSTIFDGRAKGKHASVRTLLQGRQPEAGRCKN